MGTALTLQPTEDGVLQYERHQGGERLFVALNLTSEPRKLSLPESTDGPEQLLSTIPGRGHDGGLAPDEGVILRMTSH